MKIKLPKFGGKIGMKGRLAKSEVNITPTSDWHLAFGLFVLLLISSIIGHYFIYLSLTSSTIEVPEGSQGPTIKKVELDKTVSKLRAASAHHESLIQERPSPVDPG